MTVVDYPLVAQARTSIRLQEKFPDSAQASATAYAQSGDFVRFLYREYGDQTFYQYLELLAEGHDPDAALQTAFQSTLYDLEVKWLKRVRRTYGFIPVLSGGTFLWFLMSLLAVAAYLRKRARLRSLREAEAGIGGDDWTGRAWPREDEDEDRDLSGQDDQRFDDHPPDNNTTLH